MNDDELKKKLSELQQLKKKDPKKNKFKDNNFLKDSKIKAKSLETYTQYEDEVLEDTDSIKSKKETHYEQVAQDWIDKKRALIKNAKETNTTENIIHINTLFPYDVMRSSQKKLIHDIHKAVNERKSIIAHAPTGLGKTIASLGPALEYAIRAKKTVFFLTSRQTQHSMAIRTLKDIQEKYDLKISSLDIIGKKWMCLQQGIDMLNGNDFSEFCKASKKERTCEYFNKTKKSSGMLKLEAELLLDDIKYKILSPEELVVSCESYTLCPYEIALSRGETAQVIVSDYSYVFHPNIRDIFFRKLGLNVEDCVIIVDEAHNLPDRTKDLASGTLTTIMLQRAIKEAMKFNLQEATIVLKNLFEQLDTKTKKALLKSEYTIGKEVLTSKEFVNDVLHSTLNIEATCAVLDDAVAAVRKEQKRSSIAGVLFFLVQWQGTDEGFTRIISKENYKDNWQIKYACLDPSVITKTIFDRCESSIIISGTLKPMEMYRDLLGIDNAILESYTNPFPEKNALHLIVPKTTTKYDQRNDAQYRAIAEECMHILSEVSGNTAIFFSSYDVRNKIYKYLYALDEDFVLEEPSLSKEEKESLFKKFTESSLKRKILLGASSGSFGEGVDFPGHFLECVIVVGLPLMKPTLEVNQLIQYYNDKFGKGWDYGYFYPSFNKTFQNVGRCIRSETDKGIMIYLDERFAEPRYLRFFEGRPYVINSQYIEEIREFQLSHKKQ